MSDIPGDIYLPDYPWEHPEDLSGANEEMERQMANEITDELVEAHAKVLHAARWNYAGLDYPWEEADFRDREFTRNASRAALTAVAPMLRAQGMREAMSILRAEFNMGCRGDDYPFGLDERLEARAAELEKEQGK